jgi:hypothetical protein
VVAVAVDHLVQHLEIQVDLEVVAVVILLVEREDQEIHLLLVHLKDKMAVEVVVNQV